jgi:hypothetical protein
VTKPKGRDDKYEKYVLLVAKSEGKKPPRRRWKNNINTNLRLDVTMWTGSIRFGIEASNGFL